MQAGLEAVLDQALGLLEGGAADPGSAWRTMTLGSVGLDGRPRLRSVVLRGFDRAGPSAEVHTDWRSAKVAEVLARPETALHGWDAGRGVQLRLAGPAELQRSDEAAWSALRPASRETYRMEPGPGTRLGAPDEAGPHLDEAAAKTVFTVIRIRIAELEWLHIGKQGHRRAVFRWAGGAAEAMWLVP